MKFYKEHKNGCKVTIFAYQSQFMTQVKEQGFNKCSFLTTLFFSFSRYENRA